MSLKSIFKLGLRLFIYTSVLALCLAGGSLFLLDKTFHADQIRPDLEQQLSDFFQRPFTIEKLDWTLSPMLNLSGTNVRLTEKSGALLAQSPEVQINIKLIPLLKKHVDIEGINIVNPTVVLRRSRSGTSNIGRLIQDITAHQHNSTTTTRSAYSTMIQLIEITEARVQLVDLNLSQAPLPLVIQADAQFDLGSSQTKTYFTIKAKVGDKSGKRGSLSGQGEIGENIKFKLNAYHLPIPIFNSHFPMAQTIQGDVSGNLTMSEIKAQKIMTGTFETSSLQIGTTTIPLSLTGGVNLNYSTFSSVDVALDSENTQLQANIVFPSVATSSPVIHITVQSPVSRIEDLDEWWQALQSTTPVVETSSTSSRAPTPSPEVHVVMGATRVSYMSFTMGSFQSTATIAQNEASSWTTSALLDATHITYKSLPIDSCQATATLSRSGVSFENVGLKMEQGHIDGRVAMVFAPSQSTGTPSAPMFSTEWKATDIDLTPIIPLLPFQTIAYGRLDSSGSLTGILDKRNNADLNGHVGISLSSGALSQVPGVIKVLTKLNVKSMFKQNSKTKAVMLPFDVVTATVAIQNGVIIFSQPASFQNDILQMVFMGKLNTVADTVEGTALIYFQTFVSEVVNVIPGVRTILIGDKKSLTPLTVKISGPRDNPTFDIKPVSQLTKTATNIFRNIFNLPETMIRSLSTPSK